MRQLGSVGSRITLFFYFDYKRQGEEDPVKFLQTLLHQLLARSPPIPPQASEILNRIVTNNEMPSWDELRNVFMSICNASGNVFLILDALDECDEAVSRGPVIRILNDLKKSKARLLVTSRQFAPDINQLLESCDTIQVEAATSDIRAYLLDRIYDSPRASRLMDDSLRDEVVSSILAKSQGM